MTKHYEISGNKLIAEDFTVDFGYEIGQAEYRDGIYIVRLDIPQGVEKLNNIFGIDLNGKIVWQIESPLKAFNITEETQGYDYYAKSEYVNFHLGVDGMIYAHTFASMCYIVDYKNGKLLDEKASR